MWRFLLMVFIGVAFNSALASNLEQARVASYAGYTRLVFDVPNDLPYRIDTLGAALKITFSSNRVVPISVRLNKPEVAGYTLENASGDVIAMIATPQGVSPRRGFRAQRLEPSAGKTGFRLVLDLSGAYSDISALPAVAALKLIKAQGQTISVVLDPGHGGTDSGALGNGLLESTLNLNVAFRIKKWLENSGITVEMTRTDNRVFSSNKRADLEARAEASRGKTVFVSIHANAIVRSAWNKTFGMEVFYYRPERRSPVFVSPAEPPRAADPEPSEILPELPADLTNLASSLSTPETPITPNSNGFGTWQAIPEPAPEPAPVLLTQPNQFEASKDFAAKVLSQMLGATGSSSRGVQVEDFYVLKNANCPAILVEMGFVTHPIEAAQLKNSSYLDRVSYGIAVGILEYVESLVSPIDAFVAAPKP